MSNSKIIETEQFSEAFKALSNPHRLHIFMQLASMCQPGSDCQTTCVGDLGKSLDIAPSTLSHHIKELQNAGLIESKRRGQHIDCWIDAQILKDLGMFFARPLMNKKA